MVSTALSSFFLLRDIEERFVEATEYGNVGGESMIGLFEDMPHQKTIQTSTKRVVVRSHIQKYFSISAAAGLIAGRLIGFL